MSTTYEEILGLFRQVAEAQREVAEAQKETDRLLKSQSQESDRKIQETDRKIQENERWLKAQSQETDRKILETDRKIQENERWLKAQSQKTDKEIKAMRATVDKLGSRLGDYIEDAVRPAAVRLFQSRGIQVHEVHQNVTARRDGEGIEIDLLVVNDDDVVAVECKSLLSADNVNDHRERLAKLKRLLPTYGQKRVLGAVTAMVIPDSVAQYAYRQGFFVIGQSGDQLVIRNDEDFCPKAW